MILCIFLVRLILSNSFAHIFRHQVFQIAMYSRAVYRSMLKKLDFLLLCMRLSKKALPMSLASGQL
jgi:hypothetical protein